MDETRKAGGPEGVALPQSGAVDPHAAASASLEHARPPLPEREIVHADGRIDHPRVRFEASDIRVRGLLLLVAAVGISGVAMFYGMWQVFRTQEQAQAEAKRSPYPLAPQPMTRLPEEPRLEQIDRLTGLDKANVYDRQQASLRLVNSFGRTPDKGYIRIPLDHAMKLVLADLPVRKQSTDEASRPDKGLLYFGDPNSGRVLRETPR